MKRLFNLLAFANFVIGMGGFVVIGVLSPIAEGLGVSRAEAGAAMSAYALFYAVASPVAVALTGAWERKSVLLTGLAIFAVASLAAAAAPDFTTLLLARGLMAVGAGLVTPVAASIATALAPAPERGAALSTVFSGLTVAQVIGVPIGAKLGYAFGWRSAFLAVAALSAVGAAVLARLTPAGVRTPVGSLRALTEALRNARITAAVAYTFLFLVGIYVFYTYVSRFLELRYALSGDGVTLALTLYGVGAVGGNWLGGRLSDFWGPRRTLALLAGLQCLTLPLLTLAPMALPVAFAALAFWAACGWAFMAPQQARLAGLDPARAPVLLALNASAVYLAATVGASIGGVVLKASDFWALGPAGAAVCALALVTLARSDRAGGEEASRTA